MLGRTAGFGVLALASALLFAAIEPASAEFFGCNDRQRVTYSTRSYSPSYRPTASRQTHEFAAQSSRRTPAHRNLRNYPNRWR